MIRNIDFDCSVENKAGMSLRHLKMKKKFKTNVKTSLEAEKIFNLFF